MHSAQVFIMETAGDVIVGQGRDVTAGSRRMAGQTTTVLTSRYDGEA